MLGVVQVYWVPTGTILPFTPLTGLTWKVMPEQVVTVNVLIRALGFTVTVKANGVPAQPVMGDLGVMV